MARFNPVAGSSSGLHRVSGLGTFVIPTLVPRLGGWHPYPSVETPENSGGGGIEVELVLECPGRAKRYRRRRDNTAETMMNRDDFGARRLRSVFAWAQSPSGRKYVRYVLVSGMTTVFSLTLIAVLYGTGVVGSVTGATLTGNVVAAVPAYYLHRTWTWEQRGRSHWRREVLPFWITALVSIGLSQFGAILTRNVVESHHWSHLLNTAIVSGANLFFFAVLWVAKFFVFGRIFRRPGDSPTLP